MRDDLTTVFSSVLPAPTAPPLDDRSLTIGEFCDIENFSKSYYYSLRKRGLAPDELRTPGSDLVRISASARRAWHAKLEAMARTEAAAIEHLRLVEQRRAAGKLAAESPRHVSNRGPRVAKGRARRAGR
jgi:hypothetical protein